MAGLTLPPAPDAILTAQQVADWLQIRRRQVQRLQIPVFDLGPKTKRYRAGDVLEWLAEQRAGRRLDNGRATNHIA